ncbi:MAG TPA: hypothetical protein VFK14_09435 [Solirubrobacterales bacterium]|nr:hypothetical protein [Solirubrobacterales bacterium]
MKSRQQKASAASSKAFKASSKGGFKAKRAGDKAGSYGSSKADTNGSGYRSAKTGRYVESNAPRFKSTKKRSAAVGRATTRVKTAVTVDLPRSRRSK